MYTFLKSSHQAGSNHMKKPYCVFLPLIRGFAPEWLKCRAPTAKWRCHVRRRRLKRVESAFCSSGSVLNQKETARKV